MIDSSTNYARRGDRAISYQLAGDGPAHLVLLAGTGLPGAYWTLAQTPAFCEWATCLLIDNAGTGRSDPLPDGDWTPAAMALDVVAVLDEVGWQDAHVAGHSLRAPTLVTVGESDFVTLPEYGRSLADAVAGAEFVELPDAGHMASLEQAASFNEIQRRFVERTS